MRQRWARNISFVSSDYPHSDGAFPRGECSNSSFCRLSEERRLSDPVCTIGGPALLQDRDPGAILTRDARSPERAEYVISLSRIAGEVWRGRLPPYG